MIEIGIERIQIPTKNGRIDREVLIQSLDRLVEKTKFFGKIELTYESGSLKFIKATQNFTPDALSGYLGL